MSFKIKLGDDKLTSEELKRNINHFSWIWVIFVTAMIVFVSWKFILVNNYTIGFILIMFASLLFVPFKAFVFNLGIKKAKKKHKDFVKDLIIVKSNRKRIFTISLLSLFLALVLFLFFVLFFVPNIDVVQADSIILGAHRGNSFDYLENTLEAFEGAVSNTKYQFIEFDVQYTKDKKLIVHHGPTAGFERGIDYPVGELTYEELLNISEYHIPLYTEVMEIVSGEKPLNIEIKSRGNLTEDEEVADLVIADVKRRGILDSTLISSVSKEVAIYVKDICPECETGKVYFAVPSTFLSFEGFIDDLIVDFKESKADYMMLNGSNMRNYNMIREKLPEDKTIAFWYIFVDDRRGDEMYIIDPKPDSWVFEITGRQIKTSKEICNWWWC